MSFTSDIKIELCRVTPPAPCCVLAECLGMLLYAYQANREGIRLQSESVEVRKRATSLFRQAFGVVTENDDAGILIRDPDDLARVYAAYGYDNLQGSLQLNRALVEEECCKNAFLRGAFLAGGSISTPDKGYHLELVTSHYYVARQTDALLMDIDRAPNSLMRRGYHVLYYKDGEKIGDFLSAMGATNASMELMLVKMEREMRNNINRRSNCEFANISKTVNAAVKQKQAIQKLKDQGKYEDLPAALKETAELRMRYPDLSLGELCKMFDPPISKPGLNNRIRKLIQLSEEA